MCPANMDQLRGPRSALPCADLVSCIRLFGSLLRPTQQTVHHRVDGVTVEKEAVL